MTHVHAVQGKNTNIAADADKTKKVHSALLFLQI